MSEESPRRKTSQTKSNVEERRSEKDKEFHKSPVPCINLRLPPEHRTIPNSLKPFSNFSPRGLVSSGYPISVP